MRFSARHVYGVVWCGALLAGSVFGIQFGAFFSAWMRTAVYSRASIIWLLILTLLPFLIAYWAVLFRKRWLLLLSALWEAFSFGAMGCMVGVAFGSAGWLVRFLWMFSRFCSLPLLVWFHLRLLGAPSTTCVRDLKLCFFVGVAIAITDYCLISPFLATLI